MAHCRATYTLTFTKSIVVEVACDLDAGHESVFPNHFDHRYDLEWLHRKPMALAATRTTPPSKRAKMMSSVPTQSFEVVAA